MAPQSSQASRVLRVVSEGRCNCHGHPSLQSRRPVSLPHELSSFIGRGAQLEEIAARLRSSRLVTLTGGGGIGKTRLALQSARALRLEYGTWVWTALSSTLDDAGVVATVAAALFGTGQTRPTTIDSLVATVRDHKLVLVLDNCEQVIGACAELVVRLLEECPGVRVLATSREPLGVPGEELFPVPPLALANPDAADAQPPSEAVQLFFQRAHSRDPGLLQTLEAQALAFRICATLNGVPLGIELAAACTGSMTLSEIAGRLDDILGLLRLGSRAAPSRQHSVRASIDWSHRLLQPGEQLLLRRLAIFDADFTRAAAEAVCAGAGLAAGEIGYLLDRLVAQSLVYASTEGMTTRFCLWLPVRQYALEQLEHAGEIARVRARLVEWTGADGDTPGERSSSPAPATVSPIEASREPPAERPRPEVGRPMRGRCPGVLSEREHEVVMLIAGGRSNREIADELVITKKTAEAHVSHILTKLGLCSRVQIATWSLQNTAAHGDAVTR